MAGVQLCLKNRAIYPKPQLGCVNVRQYKAGAKVVFGCSTEKCKIRTECSHSLHAVTQKMQRAGRALMHLNYTERSYASSRSHHICHSARSLLQTELTAALPSGGGGGVT